MPAFASRLFYVFCPLTYNLAPFHRRGCTGIALFSKFVHSASFIPITKMSDVISGSTSHSGKKSRPFRVSIEGNIGSGKSTCLKYFNKHDIVEIHPEPVDEWRDVSGFNLLGLLYSDLEKWNFAFQHYVHLTRLRIQTSPPKSDKIKIKIFERSVQNNRHCFVQHAYETKLLSDCEYHILNSWFDFSESAADLSLDLIVYLKTSPEVVWRRMLKRGRSEEAMVPLEYIEQIHSAYEKWINTPEKVPCEVLVIDANQDLDGVIEQFNHHSSKILGGN